MSKVSNRRQWLAERPYIIAITIAVILILWMFSGPSEPLVATEKNEEPEVIIPKVKVERFVAQGMSNKVELYGRTEPDRIVTLKAEISGKISKIHAKRGSKVKKGQPIVEIEMNDLAIQLQRSEALYAQRKMQYEGAQSLSKEGYQGRTQLSQAFADLQAAKAEIKRLKIAIENTVIPAPFDGVLNTRYVELGDYVQSGDDIAMIADLDPLVVRAHVTENQVDKLSVGQKANIRMLNRESTEGQIRYIASVADQATNTFKIEVSIENLNGSVLAGISSEVAIPLEEVPAIKVSPALLALDELGNIGVKSVENEKVKFTPINIVKTESDGVWLTGFGDEADIITLGQGFVRPGDEVEAIMANDSSNSPAALQ